MNKRCVKESQIFSGHLGEFFGFSEIIIFHIFVLESRSNFVNTLWEVTREFGAIGHDCPPTGSRLSSDPVCRQHSSKMGPPVNRNEKLPAAGAENCAVSDGFGLGNHIFLLHRKFENSKISRPYRPLHREMDI